MDNFDLKNKLFEKLSSHIVSLQEKLQELEQRLQKVEEDLLARSVDK